MGPAITISLAILLSNIVLAVVTRYYTLRAEKAQERIRRAHLQMSGLLCATYLKAGNVEKAMAILKEESYDKG